MIEMFNRPLVRLLLLFVLFCTAAIAFVELADEVFDQDTMAFDVWVLQSLNSQSTPFWDNFFLAVTQTGGFVGVVLISVAILIGLLWRKRYKKALLLTAGVAGAALLNVILKLFFERTRPDLWEQLVTETSFSFPSGHAMASSALALSLIIVLWSTRYRLAAMLIGALYVALVGLSRLYLGVHYPTDVVAGWLVSTAWVIAVWVVIYEWRARRHARADTTRANDM